MRVRSLIHGTKVRPRISVFRSNKYTYAQAIDDDSRSTITSISSVALIKKTKEKAVKTIIAKKLGVYLAEELMKKKIKAGVFDRGKYAYGGQVKAFAEGLREGGLKI